MGTYYSIYAEVRVGNKWYNLNPIFRRDNGELDVRPIIAGRSWLRETFNELEECQYSCGRPDDMSKELRTVFNHEDIEPYDTMLHIENYKEYYNRTMFLVNFGKAVKSRIKTEKPTRYKGYVSKVCLAAFEIDEYDTIGHWLTAEEYEKLSDRQKKSYTYYEWDEPDDWYKAYNIIKQRIECMLDFFCDWARFSIDDANWDERHPTADYVRLIAYSN